MNVPYFMKDWGNTFDIVQESMYFDQKSNIFNKSGLVFMQNCDGGEARSIYNAVQSSPL